MIISRRGRKSTSIIETLSRYGTSAMPSIAGTAARPPTLMKICDASSSASPVRTVRGPSKRACAWMTVRPGVDLSHRATPSFERRTTASLRALTAGMSTRIPGGTMTPQPLPVRATCAARALAISALVGMQPLLTQVPPNRLRSMIAVLRPACARRTASEGPACPVPMTMTS
jgi:hypothetical protein